MPFRALFVLATLGLAACAGEPVVEESKPSDPSVIFDIPPPDVGLGWPCPPFAISTDEELLGDSDGDNLSDCQELEVGTDPDKADTDDDSIPDNVELGVGGLLDPTDTDFDGLLDAADDDDDDDSLPTIDEVSAPDHDDDGIPSHLDGDDDNDTVNGRYEDADGDGDITNDDSDGDGKENWLDQDDDDDGVSTEFELIENSDDPQLTDTDEDGLADWLDDDDDGDGILTADDDDNGNGDPLDDDLDGDSLYDFQDTDDDGDGVPTVDEDLDADGEYSDHDSDGDGKIDSRDSDDDDDFAFQASEADPLGKQETRTYDSDGDGRPNYRDANDDGDGCPTLDEDQDGDGDPTNDNTIVVTDDVDPMDFLDPDAETCASPTPEADAEYTLLLNVVGIPAGADGSDLLVTLTDGSPPPARTSVAVSGTTATVTMVGRLYPGTTVELNLSFDLDQSGDCDAGTSEETLYSFLVSSLDVTDYDRDIEVDVTALTTDLTGVVVALDAAACAAQP